MNNKQKYGQFFTTNYNLILQDLNIPDNIKTIIEPFVGKGDLLNFLSCDKYKIETYDINDHQIKFPFKKQDTLKNPPDYSNKFVLTNPPYLARNKCNDKEIFDKYKSNDLYKCFLLSLINNPSLGGIIIIPLNFFCSLRKSDLELRDKFFKTFDIITLNIFKYQVFKDTSYQICSFLFQYNKNINKNNITIQNIIFRDKNNDKKINNIELSKSNNWLIGGEIYNLKLNKEISISRYLESDKKKNIRGKNIIKQYFYLETIDTSKERIKLIINENIFYGKNTSRTSLSIKTNIISLTIDNQKEICNIFNNILNDYRDKYDSLFLTNYRDNNRKRISFTLVYNLLNYSIMKWINDNNYLLI